MTQNSEVMSKLTFNVISCGILLVDTQLCTPEFKDDDDDFDHIHLCLIEVSDVWKTVSLKSASFIHTFIPGRLPGVPAVCLRDFWLHIPIETFHATGEIPRGSRQLGSSWEGLYHFTLFLTLTTHGLNNLAVMKVKSREGARPVLALDMSPGRLLNALQVIV